MKDIVLVVSPTESVKVNRFCKIKRIFSYYLKKYGLITFFFFLLLSGMVIGTAYSGIDDNLLVGKVLKSYMENFFTEKNSTVIGVFADSFTFSFIFAAAMILMSMSPFGIITIPAIILTRGFYCGIVSGYLCVTYGLKGFVYYICVMLIGTFLSSLALVYISQYCLDFSVSVFKEIFYKKTCVSNTLRNKLGLVILNTSYMLILIGFASLADTVLAFLIGGLFSFS